MSADRETPFILLLPWLAAAIAVALFRCRRRHRFNHGSKP
jgi:hypothetical protein